MIPSPQTVQGLGGVFLYANDLESLKDWYAAHLGLDFTCWEDGKCYGLQFPYTDASGARASTIFSIIRAEATLPPHRQACMLNWRVSDLEALLTELQAKGIPIEKREDSEYGRFAWIKDPEGNRLELYQPMNEPELL